MLLTVSGPPGSGKSTTAASLAEATDLDHLSGGDIFRELAEERGYTPLEFNKLAEENPDIDRDLDRRLRDVATDRDNLVLESRLAGWLAGDHADFKFWLHAPTTVRGKRIADREAKDPNRAIEETRAREASEAKRYLEYYDIDINDLTIYDLTVNTARWSPDAVLDMLVTAIDEYVAPDDEGKTAITGVRYDF